MMMQITTDRICGRWRSFAIAFGAFLRWSEMLVAQACGIGGLQQYLLLLTIEGCRLGEEATIRTLAERLALKHTAFELIDRSGNVMATCVARAAGDPATRVGLFAAPGNVCWEEVVRHRIGELRSNGHEFVRAIRPIAGKSVHR